MLKALLILIAAQLAGSWLQFAGHLPLPGPVVGLFLLALLLAVRPGPAPPGLAPVAAGLLRHMGLLFVPAGVGLIDHLDLLRTQALPLLGGLVGSTLLTLVVTALAMEWHGRRGLRSQGGCHVYRPAR